MSCFCLIAFSHVQARLMMNEMCFSSFAVLSASTCCWHPVPRLHPRRIWWSCWRRHPNPFSRFRVSGRRTGHHLSSITWAPSVKVSPPLDGSLWYIHYKFISVLSFFFFFISKKCIFWNYRALLLVPISKRWMMLDSFILIEFWRIGKTSIQS